MDFFNTLDGDVQEKILYMINMLKTQPRLSTKVVRLIRDGLFELKIEYESNIYRFFFIFDKGNIVVLFNGFTKKTQKTPPREIEKALRIMKEYYESKRDGK
ncbi:MAG: type II toxin-antitoxin system RelE/ParE family toxin [Clostridiales bacterium]|nr:type II toxin-antitoxin system RelE/ParE family toxin [Clostridiales bacterium]MCC8112450.1 type II toxin-antitoxin system RelE/ParE family toxin [Bacteroidales bacterium]